MPPAETLTFKKYQSQAARTAIYPEEIGLAYVALGLVDEIGELKRKVNGNGIPTGEVGDVLWYVAMMAEETGFEVESFWPLGEPAEHETRDLPDWELAHSRAGSALARAAEVAGKVKKTYRDQGGEVPKEYRAEIGRGLRAVLLYLADILSLLKGPGLRKVAIQNVNKLRDREERGVLEGDGDNR